MHLGIYVLERAFDRPDVSPIVFKVSSSAYFLIQHLTVFSILSSLLAFVTANFYIFIFLSSPRYYEYSVFCSFDFSAEPFLASFSVFPCINSRKACSTQLKRV